MLSQRRRKGYGRKWKIKPNTTVYLTAHTILCEQLFLLKTMTGFHM